MLSDHTHISVVTALIMIAVPGGDGGGSSVVTALIMILITLIIWIMSRF
jgi:hypothetical protein